MCFHKFSRTSGKEYEILKLHTKSDVKSMIGDERRKYGLPRNKTRTVMLNTADAHALTIAKSQALTKSQAKAIDKISKNQALKPPVNLTDLLKIPQRKPDTRT